MAAKQHLIRLTAQEHRQVERAVRSNKNSPRERMRARILLAASEATPRTDKQIAAQVGACLNTVARVRRRFALRGLEGTLHHAEQKRRKARKLDGRAEAHLVALTCSAPRTNANAGVCTCLAANSWPPRWSRASATRRCARRSKK